MSWFFSTPSSFSNVDNITISNAPINLTVSSTYNKTQKMPLGTTEQLFTIEFVVDGSAANKYAYYPTQEARDADFILLESIITAIGTSKAGYFTAAPTTFNNLKGINIQNRPINLDIAISYEADKHKPVGTNEWLFAIRFDVTTRVSAQYLHYPDKATRDADLIRIQTLVAAIGGAPGQDFKSTSFNIGVNALLDTKIPSKDFRFAIIEVPKDLEFIPTTGSANPDNTSTLGDALYNKNYTDLCYNNFSFGTINKPLPAINLGETKQVDSVSIWWWNAIYTAVEYKIQGSNDAQNWTDLATNLSSSIAERQDIPVDAQVQYLRMFCVQGRNSTFVVISEMEAYAIPSEKDKYINHADDKASILVSVDDTILIKNNSNKPIDIILKHV